MPLLVEETEQLYQEIRSMNRRAIPPFVAYIVVGVAVALSVAMTTVYVFPTLTRVVGIGFGAALSVASFIFLTSIIGEVLAAMVYKVHAIMEASTARTSRKEQSRHASSQV